MWASIYSYSYISHPMYRKIHRVFVHSYDVHIYLYIVLLFSHGFPKVFLRFQQQVPTAPEPMEPRKLRMRSIHGVFPYGEFIYK